jgi:coenzyme F420-reducing hydrogenase beta subunit
MTFKQFTKEASKKYDVIEMTIAKGFLQVSLYKGNRVSYPISQEENESLEDFFERCLDCKDF